MDILNGHNTLEELKHLYTHKMALKDALRHIKLLEGSSKITSAESEDLWNRAREYREKHAISNKAVEYHLRRLVDEGFILKQRNRYYLNFRSAKAIRKILFSIRDFSPEFGLQEGVYRLMDIWASRTGTEIKDAILFPDRVQEWFWDYTTEFMSVPKNLRDFFSVWFLPIPTLERAKTKGDLENRYYAHFDPKRHKYNKRHFARILVEDPDWIRKSKNFFDRFGKRLGTKPENDNADT